MGYDSADVWAESQYFQLNEDRLCEKVAGVPPDAFSDLGQKWGNPLYDWDTLEKMIFRGGIAGCTNPHSSTMSSALTILSAL